MNSLDLAAAVLLSMVISMRSFREKLNGQACGSGVPQTAPKGPKTFLVRNRFSTIRDLNRIQVRMKQPINEDQPGEPLITLNGRFKPQRIQSSWAKTKRQRRSSGPRSPVRQPMLDKPTAPMFAIESPGVIYAGYRSTVEKALKGQLDPLRKLPPFLRESKAWFRVRSTSQAACHHATKAGVSAGGDS